MINRKVLLLTVVILIVIICSLFFYIINDINAGITNSHPSDKKDNSAAEIGTNNNTRSNENNSVTGESLYENGHDSQAGIYEKPEPDMAVDNENKTVTEADNKTTTEANNNIEKNNSNEIPEAVEEIKSTEKPSANTVSILFLGIDRTEGREGTNISFASDTIMLARIDPDNRKMKALSIPRDAYVYIPLKDKMDKISYAYSFGYLEGKAVKSTIEAIEELLQKKQIIDYYFTLDMEPVPNIIDELGGIELDVEIDMKSHGVNLSKGLQLLDGKSAFDYIHWRYGEDGDIGRIKRQHRFVKAMFKKLKNSIGKNELVEILASNEQYIDSDIGLEQMVNLFTLLSDMKEEDIKFSILPGEPDYINNVSYWIPD